MVKINWDKVEVENLLKDDETISFKTYKHYLISIAKIIEIEYGKVNYLENLNNALQTDTSFKRNASVDTEKIKSILFNSWHTELNFFLPVTIGPSFMKYSMHWSPVQAYYSIYLSIRSMLESSNNPINHNHNQTLGGISEFIQQRNILPYPWNCYCSGLSDLKNLKFHSFKNKPEFVSMLSNPNVDTYENCFAKFLKTTRERQFELKRDKTNDIKTKTGKKKKKWTISDKQKIENRVHYTTLFDCMYRLRIKSNYEDVDTYILSNVTDDDVQDFYESLKIIIESTLFLFEFIITKYLGKDTMRSIIDEFTNEINISKFKDKGIFLRQNFLS